MSSLIGREEQFAMIEASVHEWMDGRGTTCIFVNGVPGTGKTVTVKAVVEKLRNKTPEKKVRGRPSKRKVDDSFEYIYINCHSLFKQTDLCSLVLAGLNSDKTAKKLTTRSALNETEQVLFNVKTLLVLDEVDSLKKLGSALFNRVLSWPSQSEGNVFIISISNQLNITENYLPKRLTSAKPKVVTFKAYTSTQITNILMDNLKNTMEQCETKAIELCAKKVASMTGDIRQAFDYATTMISMRPPIEETRAVMSTPKKVGKSDNENIPPFIFTPISPRTPASACKDAIALINRVEASPIVRAKLPFQPKFILACILGIFSRKPMKGKAQTVTKQEVFEMCERAAKKLKLESCPPEVVTEGLDILSMQGMITIGKDQKIRVVVQASTARLIIEDNDLIAQINEISV